MNNIIYKELSETVMGFAFKVHRTFGPGLLESAYEEGMCWELRNADIPFKQQQKYPLCYNGDYISSYYADLVVDDKIILELKAVKEFNSLMEAQLINYLKLSKVPVGYLINFNSLSVKFKRFVNQQE